MLNSAQQEGTVHIIEGKSFEECKEKLRSQYGLTNYSIINHREVPEKGLKGFFGKTKWELKYMLNSARPRYTPNFAGGPGESDFQQTKEAILKISGKASNSPLAEISKMIEKLDDKLDQLKDKSLANSDSHPSIQKMEEILEANEFSASVIKEISLRLRKELPLEELDNLETVQHRVADWISGLIKIEPLPVPQKPRVVVLVGPTGEGKTTTIAKLAADYRKKEKDAQYVHTICMATIDHFRVAAGAQVETYARGMEARFATANSAEELRNIPRMYSNLDVLLIDTAGYSPNDFANIGKMRAVLDIPELHPEIYLVMSASKKTGDLQSIMTNYEQFNYRAVIVTKLDETAHIGNVVSALTAKNKSVAYITTGQKVPGNIKAAESLDFLQKLADIKIRTNNME